MEFTCQKSVLQKAIHSVEKGISSRSTLLVLANLLFEINDDVLKIASTDLEIGIEKKIQVKKAVSGSILIHSKTISSIVNKLPDADVTIKVLDNSAIEIKCERSCFNIHGLPAEEFPRLPKIENGVEIVIKKDALNTLIQSTIISVSIDESKHILNGVLIDIKKSGAGGVSTDGYRLSLYQDKHTYAIEKDVKMIIPTKALNELINILSDGHAETVSVLYTESQAAFQYEDFYLTTRLIKGQYPDYQQVIPKELKTTLIIDRDALIASMERCAIIASSSANIIKLETAENQLLIQATTPDVGNVNELLPVENKDKEAIKISLNVRLILEALRIMDTKQVQFSLIDSLKPAIFKPYPENKTSDFLYVVMPIRTTDNK